MPLLVCGRHFSISARENVRERPEAKQISAHLTHWIKIAIPTTTTTTKRALRHVQVPVHRSRRHLLGLLASSAASSPSIVVYFHGFPDLSVHPDVSTTPAFASRFPRKLEELLSPAFDLLCVNFSGLPGSDSEVPYRSKLLSREVEDADAIIAFCEHKLQKRHVHVVGLSTGAILAALVRNHGHAFLRSISVVAGIADTKEGVHFDFSNDQQCQARSTGSCLTPFYWPSKWPLPPDANDFDPITGKLWRPLDQTYIEDMVGLDIGASVSQGTVPLLVIHGDQDSSIPWEHGHALFSAAADPKKWLLIKGANHLLTNTKHIKKALAEMQGHMLAAEATCASHA
ncbi:hypothetical protein H310_10471 [Aphanomyces invadans]|uniref:AB hydrolase-1 domain-containing protein n=1 Tax=Aphanomyces invadans TaxID=157072 RepID=A0A024TRQ8_9STRA|nr:hypothetical protein H310_10471 [Aphanomyces invadans]ETV96306.1 hypothetical protein H310_10471 [Aphanomyces invadans]|eukprot:XP_008875098.1 hypothetical protein H310_10471 [Aphanomyces invadans]